MSTTISRSSLFLLLKVAVSVGLISYLVFNTDVSAVVAKIRQSDPFWLAGAYALLLSQVGLATVRWTTILNAIQISWPRSHALRAVLVGLFFNQTLPSTIGGDVVRVWELTRDNIALREATASVVLDRLAALGSIILLIAFSFPFLYVTIDNDVARFSMIVAALLSGAILLTLPWLDFLPKRWMELRLMRWVGAFARDARSVVLSPKVAFKVIGVSFAITVTSGVSLSMIAHAIGLDVPLIYCCVLLPPVLLISSVPISLAGWGVREAAMVAAFAYVGMAADDTLAMSVMFGLAVLAVGLPGGIVWLRTPSKLRRIVTSR